MSQRWDKNSVAQSSIGHILSMKAYGDFIWRFSMKMKSCILMNKEIKYTVTNMVCIWLVISIEQWEHFSLNAYKHKPVEYTNTVSHFPVARQYLCSLQTLPRCKNRSQMWKDTMPEGDLFNFERFFGLCFICWELRSSSGSSNPLSHVGSSQ